MVQVDPRYITRRRTHAEPHSLPPINHPPPPTPLHGKAPPPPPPGPPPPGAT